IHPQANPRKHGKLLIQCSLRWFQNPPVNNCVGSSPTPGTIKFQDKRPSAMMAFCFSAFSFLIALLFSG
ncbi:hypothetical protein, partial [Aeromonas hydrophila]|uniref:hypothetical protein n=1 Tax=Aeromonas hydrophila TaxID=644 RepID=UPI001F35768F